MTTRTFTRSDQIEFANISRDYNPLHLDEVAARRTMLGRPIVHGLHIALWMMDYLARSAAQVRRFRRITARFNRPLFLDEMATIEARFDPESAELRCVSDGALLTQMKFSHPSSGPADHGSWQAGQATWSSVPGQLDADSVASFKSSLVLPYRQDDIAKLFPAATELYGLPALAHLLALTRVVGMEIPGLHSLFGGFSVELLGGSSNTLEFSTSRFNRKTSHVQLKIHSDVLSGTVDAFIRPQAAETQYSTVTQAIQAGEFAGRRSLIIGGSRGLGLVCAYLLAAGGAEVAVTYRVGRDEAEAVTRTIHSAGGKALAVSLDVAGPADGLASLADAGFRPTEVYYFATPHIFERKKALFEPEIFSRFTKCYVTDFAGLVDRCLEMSADEVRFFYPSSDALNHPIRELLEYSAAKAAGESFCQMTSQFNTRAKILISRLPRLPTDQTVTLLKVGAADPAAIMLRVCRAMGAAVAL